MNAVSHLRAASGHRNDVFLGFAGRNQIEQSRLMTYRSVWVSRVWARRLPLQQAQREVAGDGFRRQLTKWLVLLVWIVGLSVSLGASNAYALDVNQASALELQTLKGIGPKTADLIIQERQRGGDYQSLEELAERVKGIGTKRVHHLREQGLSVSSEAPAHSSTQSGISSPNVP